MDNNLLNEVTEEEVLSNDPIEGGSDVSGGEANEGSNDVSGGEVNEGGNDDASDDEVNEGNDDVSGGEDTGSENKGNSENNGVAALSASITLFSTEAPTTPAKPVTWEHDFSEVKDFKQNWSAGSGDLELKGSGPAGSQVTLTSTGSTLNVTVPAGAYQGTITITVKHGGDFNTTTITITGEAQSISIEIGIPGSDNNVSNVMLGEYKAKKGEDDKPMLLVFNHCVDFIRTIPVLTPAPSDPEDVNSYLEDHIYDESRYAIMSEFAHNPVNALRKQNGQWNLKKQGERWNPLSRAVS